MVFHRNEMKKKNEYLIKFYTSFTFLPSEPFHFTLLKDRLGGIFLQIIPPSFDILTTSTQMLRFELHV